MRSVLRRGLFGSKEQKCAQSSLIKCCLHWKNTGKTHWTHFQQVHSIVYLGTRKSSGSNSPHFCLLEPPNLLPLCFLHVCSILLSENLFPLFPHTLLRLPQYMWSEKESGPALSKCSYFHLIIYDQLIERFRIEDWEIQRNSPFGSRYAWEDYEVHLLSLKLMMNTDNISAIIGEISFLRVGDKPRNVPRIQEMSLAQALHLAWLSWAAASLVSATSKLSFQNPVAFTTMSDHAMRTRTRAVFDLLTQERR